MDNPRTASPPPAGELIRVEKRGGAPAIVPAVTSPLDANAIRFRVSTEDVDSMGDVVVQAGLEFAPSLPAVADHSHRLDAAIGDWHAVERSGRETFATLRLLPPGVSRAADLVRALHEGRFPLASSIWFTSNRGDIEPIMRSGANGRPMDTGGRRYKRGRVHEITLTQFPINPAAVAVARSLGFNDAELAALSRSEPAPAPPVRTITPVGGAPALRSSSMTIAEMIAAAQAAHDTAQATLATATQALEADQGEPNLVAVQRATAEVDAFFTRLTTLRSAETAAARRAAATPAPGPAAATAVSRAVADVGGDNRSAAVNTRRTDTRDVPPGWRLAQVAIACSIARERKRGVDQVAQDMFAGEAEVIAIARALTGIADTTTAGWAAELVRTETRAMLDETLVPMSFWARLAQLGMSLNFNGAHSILIPQLNIGMGTGGSAWVGESGVIPVVKGNLTAKRLFQYKLGNIIPMSKELQRTSDPSAVEQMRKIMAQFLSNLLDSSMIDALPETPGVRPAGLLFGVTPITGAAGGGYAALQKDLQAVTDAFTAAGVGSRPVLLVNINKLFGLRTMTNALGQFVFPNGSNEVLGFPVMGSAFVPVGVMVAVDAARFASAIDPLEYDLSEQATLTMANADAVPPTQAGAAPLGGALGVAGQVVPDGGIPVAGGSGASIAGVVAVSLWQTWSIGIRCVVPASFGITQAGAVQEVTGISW